MSPTLRKKDYVRVRYYWTGDVMVALSVSGGWRRKPSRSGSGMGGEMGGKGGEMEGEHGLSSTPFYPSLMNLPSVTPERRAQIDQTAQSRVDGYESAQSTKDGGGKAQIN